MRLVLVSFILMGWAFWELSGGSDFEPRKSRPEISIANTAGKPTAKTSATDVADPKLLAKAVETPEVARVTTADRALAAVDKPAAEGPSLAYRFNQPTSDATGEIQLASLADGNGAFPQPATVNAALTTEAPAAEAPGVEPEPALDIREITGSRVNMRQGPGTTYPVIGMLFYDDQVEVLEDLGDGWVQLRKVGDNQIGWMAARFVGRPAQ